MKDSNCYKNKRSDVRFALLYGLSRNLLPGRGLCLIRPMSAARDIDLLRAGFCLLITEGKKMWTVIYMAQSKESVLEVQELLTAAEFAVKARPVGEGGADGYFEILVPDTEAQQAHTLLIRNGY